MCHSYQTRLQLWFERIFSHWADIVSSKTTIVFIISFLVQIALSFGVFMFASVYKDEAILWTPMGSPTITAYETSKELFPVASTWRRLDVIVEAIGDNLLTIEAFDEMIQFEKILYSVTEFSDTKLNNLAQIERP